MTLAIVSGALANKPNNGGAAWTRLSWVLGLARLGFDVHFIEQIGRDACVGSNGTVAPFELSINLAYFRSVTEQFGLSKAASLIYGEGQQTYGRGFAELVDLTKSADLLINITGHLTLDVLRRHPRRKVYVDLDPGFTQIWHAAGNIGPRLEGHDVYVTVGENIGHAICPIPTCGISWTPVRQPVILDYWPVAPASQNSGFTTIASWRGPYGPVQLGDKMLGVKVHEFRRFLDLPQRAGQRFELALDIHPADESDLISLRRHGWQVVDPRKHVPDPPSFRRYVQSSAAEFSAAQGVYVATESGWFSDRSVRYLASGKPVLVQDTGLRRTYPVGEGLLTFRTLEEAVAGVEEIVGNYEKHCHAARALAEEYFDSDKVLGQLIDGLST